MKVAIFTDPHLDAYDKKLQEFGEFIKRLSQQVDAFICAGDWCSNNALELEAAFKTFRENTDKPLMTVFGNHDFWMNPQHGWRIDDVIEHQDAMCVKYQVTNLNVTPFLNEKVYITGFDGWYSRRTSSTKDYERIPLSNSLGANSFHFLKRKEQQSLDMVLNEVEKVTEQKKVCVTHFGWHHDEKFKDWEANPNHLPFLKEKFDMIIVGHSHRPMDKIEDGVRIINAGADYLKSPELFCKIIEL